MTEKYEESRDFKMVCDYLDSGVSEWTDALREFFLHERDNELGRWRWPENPNYVVYPVPAGNDPCTIVEVLDESCGQSVQYPRVYFERHGNAPLSPEAIAARAYFAAHPEPKPWYGAQEGEAWAITVNGKEYPAIFQAGRFRDHAGLWSVVDISDARKIWPTC